ncbi:hypothetical protein FRC03_005663 [Tulasnella sp. 419]|nr:hypothetical protein FRC03_005663 [Tulasnella sp. 419]
MLLLSFPAELLLMVADLQHTRADIVCLGRVNRRMGGICQSILFKSLTLDIYRMTSKDMKVAIDMLSKENIKHLIRSITVEGPPRVSAGLAKTLRDTILNLPNLLSMTFIDTAHQFKDIPIPSDRLQQFTCIDHWYNQSSSEDLFKFITRSSNLSEIIISIDHASGFYKTIQQVPGQFSNLRSLLWQTRK